jgi:ribosomal protein S18 acetylase RimI-like enzyme
VRSAGKGVSRRIAYGHRRDNAEAAKNLGRCRDSVRIQMMSPDEAYTLRTTLRPGDLGFLVHLHGVVYARERGWDATFEAYVAGPLADFVRSASARDRLWIAERGGRIVGCIAIVAASETTAQLRWFLVEPSARGLGLGRRLLQEAILFARGCGYREIILWTEKSLEAAAHLYRAAGFCKVAEKAGRMWGADVVEEKYELILT